MRSKRDTQHVILKVCQCRHPDVHAACQPRPELVQVPAHLLKTVLYPRLYSASVVSSNGACREMG